ncbi:MAG: ATP/GTP-binding protein [Ferruginibacter sp.]
MVSFKSILCQCLLLSALFTQAQNHTLVKAWETDSTFKVPESVLYSPEEEILFISNIDGKPNEKDLKGSISKISLDGKRIEHNWAINLSAPKGMGIYGNKLYVADLNEVVVIDIKTAKTIDRVPITGAIFLNDISIDKTGTIYVSDSRTGIIHRIKNNQVSKYMDNKMNVNGLLAVDDDLYLAVKDTLWKADKNKMLSVIATGMDESTDGIVQTNTKDFIVSCWNGIIYYVKADGNKEILLDSRAQKINTADIGFDPSKNVLYVPTFFKNNVVAYFLK